VRPARAWLRSGSPVGRSTFTTSAPQSASTAAADGTKPYSATSSTRIPASGAPITSPFASRTRGSQYEVYQVARPVASVGRHFGVPTRAADPAEGIVVVVETGQECRGLLVDDLLGKQEVVIKNLGETFTGRRGFAGAAILGDGRVGLILDTNALVRLKPTAAGSAA